MFKKILLAVTPLVKMQTAPKAAFDFARRNNAELILFHALPVAKDAWCNYRDYIPEDQLKENTAAKIKEYYADELATIPEYSIRVTTGLAHEQMLKIIHSEGVDLIIMGHHTASMDRPDRMWGSVDTTIRRVCANVFCPVLVVTNEMLNQANIQHIVLATDFSTPSDSAMCYAAQVARTFGAHLDVFHVLDIGQPHPNPKYYMQDMDNFITKAVSKMDNRYQKALKDISHSYECWEGVPYMEILKKARWSKADLIIMAQYSSSCEVAKPMIGSTSIQVALSPGCPALIVNYRARNCM